MQHISWSISLLARETGWIASIWVCSIQFSKTNFHVKVKKNIYWFGILMLFTMWNQSSLNILTKNNNNNFKIIDFFMFDLTLNNLITIIIFCYKFTKIHFSSYFESSKSIEKKNFWEKKVKIPYYLSQNKFAVFYGMPLKLI